MIDWEKWIRKALRDSINESWVNNSCDEYIRDGKVYDSDGEEIEPDVSYDEQIEYHLIPLVVDQLTKMHATILKLESEIGIHPSQTYKPS